MTSLQTYLEQSSRALTEACTTCGKCVEVCPVTPTTGVDPAHGPAIMKDLLSLLAGGPPLEGDAQAWAQQCNGCGHCIPHCPESVNPRRLVMLAHAAQAKQAPSTPQLFRKMARSIRIMAAMQLVPDELNKLLQAPRARDVPVVFYLGCNPVRTPHLLFNAMTVLDQLEIDYEVVGGPGACCGIIHSKWEADLNRGDRVVNGTLDRFESFKPDRVLSWCPSCVLHLGETMQGFRDTSFGFDHITDFFVEHADTLQRKFVTPVRRRVLLHAHDGMGEIGRNVERLIASIPGLTLVGTALEPGYTCGGSGADRSPELKRIKRAETLSRAASDDVDTLVTLFHGCHAQLASEEKRGQFEVLNWTDLLVEALGATPHDDISKRYRMQDDIDLILDEGETYLRANGVEIDRAWLKRVLPDIFAQKEFKGGLDVLVAPAAE